MDVWSPSAVPVGILWWNGPTRRLTIIAKMTLMPKAGALVLADEQEPLRLSAPSSFDVPEELHYSSDFVPFKPRCDVLVVGSAYSPTEASIIPVHVRVGACDRRVYALAGQPSTSIPLSSLYLRREPVSSAEEVAVGPLSPHHPHRARFADARIPPRASGFERTNLPADFDGRYFNTGPIEQQTDPITPGMALVVPSRGAQDQTFWIPPLTPRIFLFDQTTESGLREVAMTCDTIWIDTDRERYVLTFRGVIDPAYGGQFPSAVVAVFASIYDAVLAGAARMICSQATVRKATEPQSLEEEIAEPALPDPTITPSRAASFQDEEGTSLYTISSSKASTLPFASTSIPRSEEAASMLPDAATRPPVLPFVGGASALSAMSDSTPAQQLANVLPFVQAHPAPTPAMSRPATTTAPRPRTLVPGVTVSGPALPFVQASHSLDARPESPPFDTTSRSVLPFVSNEPRKRPSTMPPAESIVSTEYDRPSAPPPQALPFVSTEHDRPSAPPPQALHALPFVSNDPKPSVLGRFDAQPLAGAPLGTAAAPSVSEPAPALDTSALMRLSLDTFAEIKVDLWSGVGLREALAKHGIDQRSYHLYERRQTEELGDDVRQGALDRTRALRAALRRARERRGPISTDDGIL
ncbi:MAG: DUF2169 domain-containing protein [Polyangiaceae bacterium]|nr:DUF2169 domain-containing protein [Polyangiaceae bacterium]